MSGFTDIDALVGGAGIDTLIGQDDANNWSIISNNAGTVDGVAFSAIENLSGGSGVDDFVFGNGAGVSGTIAGSGGRDTLDYAAYTTGIAVNLQSETATGIGGFTDIESLVGGSASDTLVGFDSVSTWSITASNAGAVAGFGFAAVENLTGGTAADTYTFGGGGSVSGGINGAAGSDTVVGADTANVWNITASTAGDLNGHAFINIENLSGGNNADAFVFSIGAGVTGTVAGGGGMDTLNYAAYTTGIALNLQSGAATGLGGFTGIEALVGGSASDTLVGFDRATTWTITANNTGNVSNFAFAAEEN
jgi:hypothetical protein